MSLPVCDFYASGLEASCFLHIHVSMYPETLASHYLPCSEGDIIFSMSVCVFVCLSVCQHDSSRAVRDIITKFSGHHVMVQRVNEFFKNDYRGEWQVMLVFTSIQSSNHV